MKASAIALLAVLQVGCSDYSWRFEDDFDGAAFDANKWIVDDAQSSITFDGDSARARGGLFEIKTADRDLGLRDFHFGARVKLTEVTGATGQAAVRWGFVSSSTGARSCYLYFLSGDTTWTVSLAGENHVTTLAPVPGAWFELEIRRDSGVFVFMIDGAPVYTATVDVDMVDEHLGWVSSAFGIGSIADSSVDRYIAHQE